MLGASTTLPMLPGYALGGIIPEANLLLSQYEKRRISLSDELLKIEQDKFIETNSDRYIKLNKDEQQKRINFYAQNLLKIKKEIDNANSEIDKLIKEANPFTIEELLPLDEKNVKIRIENRSFKTERLNHLQFTSKEPNVYGKIQTFVSQLFLQEASLTMLPSGTLEVMAKNVGNMLGEANTEVTLIGSFITLERVKTIDPLLIRPNAKISETLVKNATKYYVLSEVVLGGVFLGLGKSFSHTTTDDNANNREDKQKSSLLTVSFLSQGAIPKLSDKNEEVDLWKVYNDWKNTMRDDPHGGYPIGFKVRRLTDVFYENGLEV